MKFFLAFLFLFTNLALFAQRNLTQKKQYVDFVAGLDPSIVFLDKNMNNIFGGYGFILFKNQIYTGIFLERKFGETSAKNPISEKYQGGNLHYANGGAYVGIYLPLKIKKVKRTPSGFLLTRVNISMKMGVGRIWLVNKSNNKLYNRINYLGCFTPRLGFEYPLYLFAAIGGGIEYHLTTNNKIYFENSRLSGFGFYLNLRFSFFNNSSAKSSNPTRL